MKVIQVKCPRCQQPIYSKVKDGRSTATTAAPCTSGTGPGGHRLRHGEFNMNAPPDRTYMPFWRLFSTFSINQSKVAGEPSTS
jgi:hypothetical protein